MRIVERHSRGMRIFLARGGWSILLPLRYALSMGHRVALCLGRSPAYRRAGPRTGGRPRIVSVGNITAGGTGKTPCVLAVARELLRRGHRPVVVSGGYGGTARDSGVPVAVRSSAPDEGRVDLLGDEATLYLDEGFPVVVCRNRARGIEAAGREFGPTHVLLDDAFHRTELEKDLDILLLDHEKPFGNGLLLPGGPLREPPSAAGRADAVVFTRARSQTVPREAARRIGGAPVFFARHVPAGLSDRGGEAVDPAALGGRPVVLFSGIARHDSFEELALAAGLAPDVSVRFDDHHRYRSEDAGLILSECGRDAVFITTAKDWRKAIAVMPADAVLLRLGMRMEIPEIERLLARVLTPGGMEE